MSKKYEQLAGILRSELQQLVRQGGSRLATEAVLAERYHMSRQTVRHALKLLEEEGLIVRRQGSGSFVRTGAGETGVRQVAVVTTFLDDYIFPSILHDVQGLLSQQGYSTLVFATENLVSREREILTKLLDMQLSAVLMEGVKTALPTVNADLYQLLRARGIPVLFLHGTYCNLGGFPSIQDDNYSGGYQLTRYLLSKGHTRIPSGTRRWSGSAPGSAPRWWAPWGKEKWRIFWETGWKTAPPWSATTTKLPIWSFASFWTRESGCRRMWQWSASTTASTARSARYPSPLWGTSPAAPAKRQPPRCCKCWPVPSRRKRASNGSFSSAPAASGVSPRTMRAQAGLYSMHHWVPLGVVPFY